MQLGRRMGRPSGAPGGRRGTVARALLGGAGCVFLASAAAPAWAFGPPAIVPQPAPPPPAAPADVPPAPAGDAIGGPSTPPIPAYLVEARLHFQQGVALFRDQNFDAALAEFRGAYGISGEPVVLYNVGLTFKALFRYAEAIDVLERYLAESAAHGHPVAKERRAEVETLVNEMRSLLADVTVVLSPAEATLHIDGRPTTLGVDGGVKLPAGTHVLEASAPDHVSARREITVVAGTPQSVPLELAAVPHTGNVPINASQIGAHIAVDGRDLGASPVTVELGAGGHQVVVTAPGYMPGRSELAVAPGQSRTVTIVLEMPPAPEPAPFYHKWWFWTGAAEVAAATVTTILLWPASKQSPLSGTLGIANTSP